MPEVSSLAVWAAGIRAGLLERDARQEYIFAYSQETGSEAQVSLTMPVRLASWTSRELHPIFQMNLPEGALLETIRHLCRKHPSLWKNCLPIPPPVNYSMNSLQNMPCVPAYQAFSPRCCSMQRDGAQWRHQTIL